ncbi:DUF6636 domain-containing protein [Roseobacter sp. HKCCA0434]|uniref:DUF6636 domain-containing protein n=1 Tax=Roseobacter sp. HKCCA0434 TaxID=3079297 RepID=UPI002905BBFC|nr:DUF6636 domain-containing protein [Roseobacter sp. HKCCA0434]
MLRLTLIALSIASPALAEDIVFTSPSGNIRCILSDSLGGARCDLGVTTQSFTTPPADCDGDWGQSFGVGRDGAGAPLCVTDAIGGADPLVLPYGAGLSYGGIECLSSETGMTCVNRDGGGFALRRAEQSVF